MANIQTSTMTCIYASNLVDALAFIAGKTYDCYKDGYEVFVKDDLGISVQVQTKTGLNGSSVWSCSNNGEFHFVRNK